MKTPSCPFCLENNILPNDILHETDGGFLIQALGDGGNYLIIPKTHTEDPAKLPDGWWADFKKLLLQVPIDKENYNLSLNVGEQAGQTLKHLHFWVIPRKAGLPTSGKGLAALINAQIKE